MERGEETKKFPNPAPASLARIYSTLVCCKLNCLSLRNALWTVLYERTGQHPSGKLHSEWRKEADDCALMRLAVLGKGGPADLFHERWATSAVLSSPRVLQLAIGGRAGTRTFFAANHTANQREFL